MTDSTVFADITKTLGADLTENLFQMSGDFISGLAPVFSTLFGIYLLMIVFSYWSGGGMTEMAVDLFKKMIVWSLLIAFAFNAATYFEWAQWAYALPDDLGQLFGNKNYGASGLDASMDELSKLVRKIEDARNELSWYDVGTNFVYIIAADAIMFFCLLVFGFCFAFYMLGKISLAMVLMIGPLFLGFLMFPATRSWGMNWIGQVLNYVILILLFVILGIIQQKFFDAQISSVIGSDFENTAILLGLIPTFTLATVLFIIVAINIPNIAQSLTGGAVVSAASRQVASVLRAAKGVNFGGGKGGGGNMKG